MISGKNFALHFIGIGSFIAAAALSPFSPILSVAVLVVFIIVSVLASFFPETGFYLPVISKGSPDKNTVAVTFDDGPDPNTTPALLKLLATYDTKATFFVVGHKARQHPHLIREILSSGHNIGNHTFSHDVFIMLKSRKRLHLEIESTQDLLAQFGITPLAFRPPVGIVNPGLGKILHRMGMFCVNYSCRGLDMGNRRINNLSDRVLEKIKPGDILLLHDTNPENDSFLPHQWINEVEMILSGTQEKGLQIIPLQEIVGRPVMKKL